MRHPLVAALLLLSSLVGCEKAGKRDVPKVPEPAELIAVVSLASPSAMLERVRAYAEAVSPGSGAALRPDMIPALLSSAVGASSLPPLALDGPMHLLVLDPRKFPQPVLLARLAGEAGKVTPQAGTKVLIEKEWMLAGPEAQVDLVSAYAFGVVARGKAPDAPTVTCSPGKLVALYRADLEELQRNMGTAFAGQPGLMKILELEIDLFLRLAAQTDELRLVVDAQGGEASLSLVLVPKTGTMFEGWARAQKPGADATLLARLPRGESPTLLMVGNLQLGPLRDLVRAMMDVIREPLVDEKLDVAKWNAWLDGLDGRYAGSMWTDAQGVTHGDQIYGTSDGARSAALAAEVFAFVPGPPRTFEILGMKMSWEVKPATTHEGATISLLEMVPDFASFPEMQRELMRRAYGDVVRVAMAGADRWLVLSMSPDAPARIRRGLEVARAGGGLVPGAAAKAAFEAASGRKASLAMFIDVARMMAQLLPNLPPSTSGMTIELGVSGGRETWLRIGMPAAHVGELMNAFTAARR